MNSWGVCNSQLCDCGLNQTADHLAEECGIHTAAQVDGSACRDVHLKHPIGYELQTLHLNLDNLDATRKKKTLGLARR